MATTLGSEPLSWLSSAVRPVAQKRNLNPNFVFVITLFELLTLPYTRTFYTLILYLISFIAQLDFIWRANWVCITQSHLCNLSGANFVRSNKVSTSGHLQANYSNYLSLEKST